MSDATYELIGFFLDEFLVVIDRYDVVGLFDLHNGLILASEKAVYQVDVRGVYRVVLFALYQEHRHEDIGQVIFTWAINSRSEEMHSRGVRS